MTDIPARYDTVPADKLLIHEEVEPDKVDALVERLKRDGAVRDPVVVDAASMVILDGHHRFAALRRIGCRKIPVHLVPYDDPGIVVGAWRDEPPATKAEIVERARTGRLFPPKTTKHEALRRLPERPTPIAALMGVIG